MAIDSAPRSELFLGQGSANLIKFASLRNFTRTICRGWPLYIGPRYTPTQTAAGMVPPRRPPPPAWVGSMAMAQLALWLGLYAPLKTLVPLLAAQIAAGGAD